MRTAAVVAAVVALGACSDPTRRASFARVVVEAEAAEGEPLRLVVSTNFDMILNIGDGSSTPYLNDTDSVSVTAGYEETYALDRTDPRFFVKLHNVETNDEAVRLAVFLDEEAVYDVSATIASGAYLQYTYHFNTLGVSGN
jgi:hypothetical protein